MEITCSWQSVDYGRMAEILVQRAGSSDEFTRLTSITWVCTKSSLLTLILHLGYVLEVFHNG